MARAKRKTIAMSVRQDLTRGWIQYLKNNQIVELQSSKTGRLKYKRKPTVSDVVDYLDTESNFSADEIKKAIKTVLSKKSAPTSSDNLPAERPDTPASTWTQRGMSPGTAPGPEQHKEPIAPPEPQKKYSNDDAEDVPFRDIGPEGERVGKNNFPALPGPKRKPRLKYKDVFKEAIYDKPGIELDEKDIQEIFTILANPEKPEAKVEPEVSPDAAEVENKKQEEIRKIKRLIRDTLTDSQRMALWRALTDA